MNETSSRLLTLLSLLQARRDWPGRELAERLEVSGRTIRRDVERLRELGYPVESLTGPAGGYRLASGTAMPPLLLDDDEAIAIAVGLRTAARASVAGIEETSVRALVKLEQVLPVAPAPAGRARSGRRPSPIADGGPTVDPQALTVIATACRDSRAAFASPTAAATAPRPAARSSRTRSSTSGGAGTCSPGTAGARTGAPSASTGSAGRPRPGSATPAASRRPRTPPSSSPAASPRRRSATRRG